MVGKQPHESFPGYVTLGSILSAYGVKGWVKVYSWTDPRENILNYRQWLLVQDHQSRIMQLETGRAQGKGLVAQLAGIRTRDQALACCGARILVEKSRLPKIPASEYYWHQLEGLTVLAVASGSGSDVRADDDDDVVVGKESDSHPQHLGQVHHLMDTGANDVLVVRPTASSVDTRERLIPYLPGQVILEVDLLQGTIMVDWDPEF
jgi:16S rRNA processing protein RimM